ncbi:MAG: TrpB-like pyridoxal-phosphate dependent enzyme [Stygiobacter sp. RIFOXYC12_FULL_38_8]|nr:MAG: TrpB-like pyridoxal-phosphate dependent enzyme [Stygiobacter sp. GWC2_38_9]OGU79595.1 MAG: TrpB-like pyridoxal-phosphate dependent enzyme [Stygiobacter sp. RIFOXYA12_FULL_38_9]OGV07240.1 MAG: TrpB-like pyridoxal-phosphate dependent enzyme [Stygiobacter sp. RIFOXYB2_FULL_37_11]OGV10447.1 MAG: TrpB-like pyridoxal-phosphate dependent enzyme [Stygiobacter sp. RIFOXYA2_FULL_38_8]OGV14534.1 MAG: TrpB-like pyridoxal-phosphate dependent enzyme [Stygiobacter sp. RIFOXYC2_FULL_38_25]OGV29244.1 M
MSSNKIVFLEQKQMPTHYYNILADLPVPMEPPLHPGTKQPAGPQDLSAIFPMDLIMQEVSQERFIEIPDEVRDLYRISRPTPLVRAANLENALGTPAKIYFKYEGANPTGSHKTNTSYPQAYYNKKTGIKKLVTETGAGQWGSALSMACKHFGMECEVFMVKVSYNQKPYRRTFMKLFGATVHASPTNLTNAGRNVLEKDPDSPGSLGIAISEAIEVAVQRDDTNYSLGSVLNHVMLHQTIIGEEARKQMEMVDEYPDIVIGCAGGGSNFAGLSFPFLRDKLAGTNKNMEVIAVEPASCPSLTQGKFEYDFGDEAGMTPLLKMYTLGHQFIPPKIHAGGLRYHGMAPTISHLYHHGFITANAYDQVEVFEAAQLFAQTEGLVPAPESAHAVKEAIVQALKCKESGEAKTILFNLSGHGFLDLGSYEMYLENQL